MILFALGCISALCFIVRAVWCLCLGQIVDCVFFIIMALVCLAIAPTPVFNTKHKFKA